MSISQNFKKLAIRTALVASTTLPFAASAQEATAVNNQQPVKTVQCEKGTMAVANAAQDALRPNTVPLLFRQYENIDKAAVSISNYAQRRNPDVNITCHIDVHDLGQKTATLSVLNKNGVSVVTEFNLESSVKIRDLLVQIRDNPDHNHLLSAVKLANTESMMLDSK